MVTGEDEVPAVTEYAALVKTSLFDTLTVTDVEAVWVIWLLLPPTPWIATVEVPAGVLLVVATLRVEVRTVAERAVGLKVQVAFVGHPEETVRFTVDEKLLVKLIVTV